MLRDSVDNTVEENFSVFSLIRVCWLPSARPCDSKTLHQQNPPVLNWRCRLTQVNLYNGRKTVFVVVVKYHLVTPEPPFRVKKIECIYQTWPMNDHSVQKYITVTLEVYHDCHSICRFVKYWSCYSLSLEWKSLSSITLISHRLNK